MKAFLVILVLAGAAYAAYHFGYLDTFLGKDTAAGEATPGSVKKETPATPASRPGDGDKEKPGATLATGPKPAKPKKTEIDRQVEELYPMPEIKPLMELVGNWNAVPARVFPKDVVLKVDVDMELSSGGQVIGKSTSKAGSTVSALSLEGATLTIGPSGSDSIRGTVGVEETDFKAVVTKVYDDFVTRRRQETEALREAEKTRIIAQKKAAAEGGTEWVAVGYTDGSAPQFAPVKASLKSGEAGDRELESAKRFRWLGPEWVKGTLYDSALVQFEVETMFGVFKSEIKALLQNDKVVRWVQPDTNEPLKY